MMASARYPYTLVSVPAGRTRYAYSPFIGEAFIDAWRDDRSIALTKFGGSSNPPPMEKNVGYDPISEGGHADAALEYIWGTLCAERNCVGQAGRLLERLLQRFEVSLRLHEKFDKNFRPVDRNAFADLTTHLRLGEIFSEVYRREHDLRFLSALSKLIDGLIPVNNEMTASQLSRLTYLIEREVKYVERLIASPFPVCHQQFGRRLERTVRSDNDFALERRLDGVVILAARTARSQAYVQAIAMAGMRPERLLIYGTQKSGFLGQFDSASQFDETQHEIDGLFLPNLGETIERTAGRAGWDMKAIAEDDINSTALIAQLRDCKPRLTLFSGYGGQIVGSEMLSVSPFIHAHAGRLPQYRGSTTIYYSWLLENKCSVTTFLLSSQLDRGRILRCKDFSPPPKGLDVDYVFDSAIRADCMVETLSEFVRIGELKPSDEQLVGELEGRLHFIIHPLLRHVVRTR